MSGFRPGDVVEYEPDRSSRWCREGMALAAITRDGRLVVVDTFWSTGSEAHALTDSEKSTARFLFNTGDYDELDEYSRSSKSTWERYAPEDRRRITSQHGLQVRWFIRKGALEDLPTQIGDARERLEKARGELRSAQYGVELAECELAELEAKSGVLS